MPAQGKTSAASDNARRGQAKRKSSEVNARQASAAAAAHKGKRGHQGSGTASASAKRPAIQAARREQRRTRAKRPASEAPRRKARGTIARGRTGAQGRVSQR